MLCVCVGDVMDVVFSVCIVRRGAVGAHVWGVECFIMQMVYVCVLCASCGSSQCCVLHDLQFVNAGRGCNRRPYRRGIHQSRSHNCFIDSHECLLLLRLFCVLVIWLRWCRWGLGMGIGSGSEGVGCCYVCVRCESGLSV